jgi:hypothetical protein
LSQEIRLDKLFLILLIQKVLGLLHRDTIHTQAIRITSTLQMSLGYFVIITYKCIVLGLLYLEHAIRAHDCERAPVRRMISLQT